MKSKKIIALALTAAIAISAASMTAFAKEVKYNNETDVKVPDEVVATVVLTKDDVKETKIYPWKLKNPDDKDKVPASINVGTDGKTPIANDDYQKLDGLQDLFVEDTSATPTSTYSITFGQLKLKNDYEDTITKDFQGWTKVGQDDAAVTKGTYTNASWGTDADPTATVAKDSDEYNLTAITSAGKVNGVDVKVGEFVLVFDTVGRKDTTEENIKKNTERLNKAADKEKAAKNREEELEKLDKENNATDNVNTNSSDGVVTKKAEVTYGPIAAADTSKVDDKHPEWVSIGGHDLSVVGVELNASNLAWVYNVEAPEGLIKGKNARATLDLPDGYTTSGYKVSVYHVKGWCTSEKVKNVNVGTNDVTFWANDFSPYVLILTPRDAIAGTSTGNPSTGDFSAVPVAMLAAAALGATGFVAYKKRKAE